MATCPTNTEQPPPIMPCDCKDYRTKPFTIWGNISDVDASGLAATFRLNGRLVTIVKSSLPEWFVDGIGIKLDFNGETFSMEKTT